MSTDDPNMVDKTKVKAGNSAEFEVQENGTYRFVVVDNVGNGQKLLSMLPI